MAGIVADISQYLSVQDNLRQLNAQIIALEDLIRSDQDVAREIAQDVLELRTNYEAAAARYIDLYRTAVGTVPSGLTGLGILPTLPAWAIVTIAILAEVVAGMLAYAAILWARGQDILHQKELLVAQNQSNLIAQGQNLRTQAGAADQRGDSQTAAQLRAQADSLDAQAAGLNTGTTSTSTGILAFLENNWPWLLLAGGAGFFILREL